MNTLKSKMNFLVIALTLALSGCNSSESSEAVACNGTGTFNIRTSIINQRMDLFGGSEDTQYDFDAMGGYTVDYDASTDAGINADGTYVYTVDPEDSTRATLVLTQVNQIDPADANIESVTEAFTLYGTPEALRGVTTDIGTYCYARTTTYVDATPDAVVTDSGEFGLD